MTADGRNVRRLVLLSRDSDLESLELTDALDCLDDGGTSWLVSDRARRAGDVLRRRDRYAGSVRRRDVAAYSRFRLSTLYEHRHRSRDLAVEFERSHERAEAGKDAADPSGHVRVAGRRAPAPLRAYRRMRLLKSVPLHEDLLRAVGEARPDLVVLPFSEADDLVTDAVRCCDALDVPTLMVYVRHEARHGDVLDPRPLEEALAVPPTRVAVWGEAGRDRLATTLGLEDERIALLGAPSFDTLFEESANAVSADVIAFIASGKERRGDGSPAGLVRAAADELVSGLEVVELERKARRAERLALIARARVVVSRSPACVLESAATERPHLLLAFSGKERGYRRLQGVDLLQGVEVCKRPEDIARTLAKLLEWRQAPPNSLRKDIRYWIHHDDRSYGERLVALADELVLESSRRPAAVTS